MSDRKDHIKVLKQFLKDYQEWGESLELEESVKFAINSLEVDEAYQLEYEKPQDEVVLRFSKGTLKYRCKDYVVYKKEWLRSHYGAEIDIMFGDKQYLIPTITLNKLKEIREEIGGLQTYKLFSGDAELYLSKDNALDVLDKRISELEK